MRIYKKPEKVVRLYIKKRDYDSENLTVYETTKEEVSSLLKDVFSAYMSLPPTEGYRTSVQIKSVRGEKNLDKEVETISFRSLNPEEAKKLILDAIGDE